MTASEHGNCGRAPPLPRERQSADTNRAQPRSFVNQGAARADYLEYIADMAREMRVLAEANGCQTLAGLLDLAFREARREADRS